MSLSQELSKQLSGYLEKMNQKEVAYILKNIKQEQKRRQRKRKSKKK